ncbi:hypothetical protein HOY82DRAFT_243926 [Tuber indicum]|nr:hypothetical protein HOY82DRAFT_243926 [Tuber indicum]
MLTAKLTSAQRWSWYSVPSPFLSPFLSLSFLPPYPLYYGWSVSICSAVFFAPSIFSISTFSSLYHAAPSSAAQLCRYYTVW